MVFISTIIWYLFQPSYGIYFDYRLVFISTIIWYLFQTPYGIYFNYRMGLFHLSYSIILTIVWYFFLQLFTYFTINIYLSHTVCQCFGHNNSIVIKLFLKSIEQRL
jgi:hypothetical protein